jgi:hypothetical protein
MMVTFFLDGNPFAEKMIKKLPFIGEIVEINGKTCRVIKRAWFLNEIMPFIGVELA